MKRMFSLVLSAILLLGGFPIGVYAAGDLRVPPPS